MHDPSDHPGVTLRNLVLPALALSVSQAARDLQITRQTLHRILAGTAAITPDIASRLERLCGIPSHYWLRRQQDCELKRINTQSKELYDRIPHHALPPAVLQQIGALDD